jgi:cation transporter-like permease
MIEHVLETAAQEFADATSRPPFLYELPPMVLARSSTTLTEAGARTPSVRYNGIIHDFMTLNPVRDTAAATGAIEHAIHILRKAFRTN